MDDVQAPAAGRESPEGGEEWTLEARLRRLETIIGQLESDEVPLERAMELFEEGVGHVRAAERILAEAELRVDELLEGGETRPFEGTE